VYGVVVTRKGGAMHVVATRRQYKDKVYETHLLRRSYREGGKVKNETLANLVTVHLPGSEGIHGLPSNSRTRASMAETPFFRVVSR
jgi:hypothetical protein